MNIKGSVLIPAFLLFLVSWSITFAAEAPRVRMGHIRAVGFNVPDDYLLFLQDNGYNYILVDAELANCSSPAEWNLGTYVGGYTSPNSLYGRLKSLIEKADKYGIRAIPKLAVGNRYCGDWSITNANIVFNTSPSVASDSGSPYAADPNGFDRSFLSYLGVLRRAFNDATRRNYPTFEYFHLAHDEMLDHRGNLLIAWTNPLDQAAIRSYGGNEAAYQRLIAESIARRVGQVRSVLGLGTRCIIYGDQLDPRHTGGWLLNAWSPTGMIQVTTSGALTRPELTNVAPSVVLSPWFYWDNQHVTQVLDLFTVQNNYNVIPCWAYPENPASPAETVAAMDILSNVVGKSCSNPYIPRIVGLCALNWVGPTPWRSNPVPDWYKIIPDMASRGYFIPPARLE